MTSGTNILRHLTADPSESGSRRAAAPWDMTVHMRHARVCDTFLTVAEESYADLLPRVREDLARAMSLWFLQDGYRAEIAWSDIDACFVGRIKNLSKDVEFSAATPSELHLAFKDAVKAYIGTAPFLLPPPRSASCVDHRA